MPRWTAGIAQLPRWALIFDPDLRVVASSQTLAELSRGGEVVCLAVNEHVLSSHAGRWRDGKLDWLVRFDAAVGDAAELLLLARDALADKGIGLYFDTIDPDDVPEP